MLRHFTVAMIVCGFVAACGSDPLSRSQKDLSRQEDQTKDAQARADQAENKASEYLQYLKNVNVSSHYAWVWTMPFVSNREAASHCTEIGFRLPNGIEIQEFITELVPSKFPAASKDPADYQRTDNDIDVDKNLDKRKGLVVCLK